jgi:hypothetical protein
VRWRSLSIENRAYLPAADLAQVPGVYASQFYDSHADGSVKPNHLEVPERILRRVATPIPAYFAQRTVGNRERVDDMLGKWLRATQCRF